MPPKKNKKPSKNGYWQYVLECRDKSQNRNLSMQELQNYASKKWANMSKEDRQPYEQMAALARDSHHQTRYTTDGYEIDEIERQQKEAADKVKSMRDDISKTLKSYHYTQTLDEQPFLIIHINHLVYYPIEDRFFICEVAIAAVSLKNGVEEVFHQLVKPGTLPMGYYGHSLAHSKQTHQLIDVVLEEPVENNTKQVFTDIISFMTKYGSGQQLPILYADEKTLEMTRNVFENWQHEFEFSRPIQVYNFQYFFYALRNVVAQKQLWANDTFSYNILEKDVYSYTPKISCDYHEISDISVYCSKSIVTRYAFTICDHCCADLDIQLTPGFHVPEKSKIVQDSRTSSLAPSICSADNYMPVPRTNSISLGGYEENYPPLGSRSSASSIVSFSSMRTVRGGSANKAASRIEQSFRALSVTQSKRDHKDLKFPQHGCDKQNN